MKRRKRISSKRHRVAPLILAVGAAAGLHSAEPTPAGRPKYAAGVATLTEDHAFFRENSAGDFWRLMPHYTAQPNDAACSIAVAATIVNAARPSARLSAGDELATPAGLLEKVGDAALEKAVGAGGGGVALAEMSELIGKSLAAYGVKKGSATAVPVDDQSPATRDRFRQTLAENERSGGDFLIANVLQSALTGDRGGAVGHFVVVAAYDAKRDRVLVLDSDRRWYEPYWVTVDALLAGMATSDPDSKKSRGYIRVVVE